jgi:hypothetical protein
MAIKYGCKYIETSPGINHNVDELLVGMLAQLQLKLAMRQQQNPGGGDGGQKGHHGGFKGFKVLDNLLERVWKRQDNTSKSCGNLHVL